MSSLIRPIGTVFEIECNSTLTNDPDWEPRKIIRWQVINHPVDNNGKIHEEVKWIDSRYKRTDEA